MKLWGHREWLLKLGYQSYSAALLPRAVNDNKVRFPRSQFCGFNRVSLPGLWTVDSARTQLKGRLDLLRTFSVH